VGRTLAAEAVGVAVAATAVGVAVGAALRMGAVYAVDPPVGPQPAKSAEAKSPSAVDVFFMLGE
jgi:hypothetical protein